MHLKNCPVCGADLLNNEDDEIIKLFNLWKHTHQEWTMISLGERMLVERLINEFTYDKVYEAFLEASSERQRMKISYVRGILKGKIQKEFTTKNKMESDQLKKDLNKKNIPIGGFDFSDLLGKMKIPEESKTKDDEYKKSERYKAAKKDFEKELKNAGHS